MSQIEIMTSLFKKTYTASSIIDEDLAIVWTTLIDLRNYHLWNPFTPAISTDWSIGGKVKLTVRMKKGQAPLLQTEYLSKFNPPFELGWGINWGIFLKAERTQKLTDEPNGRKKYHTEDIIHGILCPVVHWMYGKYIQKGFEEVAVSLKKHVEGK